MMARSGVDLRLVLVDQSEIDDPSDYLDAGLARRSGA